MSNNLKVNSKTQTLEFKRKHNELVENVKEISTEVEEIPNVETAQFGTIYSFLGLNTNGNVVKQSINLSGLKVYKLTVELSNMGNWFAIYITDALLENLDDLKEDLVNKSCTSRQSYYPISISCIAESRLYTVVGIMYQYNNLYSYEKQYNLNDGSLMNNDRVNAIKGITRLV